MKKLIHHSNYIKMLFLCIVLTSCKTVNTEDSTGKMEAVMSYVKQDSGTSVSTEKIPILAWVGVYEHTVERYIELKECGIDYNFTGFENVEIMAQMMDAANVAGIKMLIHCPELETEPEKIVNRFKDHPALAGYWIRDEPHLNEFSDMGIYVRRIQAVDNKHFCYANLFANFPSLSLLGITDYLEYVQLFLQEVPVPFLSFDNYPIEANASGKRSLRSGWYENLEIISNEASKARIPFWAFALTTAHGPYPIPTLEDLRLQVFSNLAYGAQGIQYFTYWTPRPIEWDFHDGPIYNGQRTPTWYTVQQMNREIKALSGVFLGAQVIKVEHITKTALCFNGAIPTGTTRFNFDNRPPEASIIKTFTIPGNTNAVVSFLKNGNRCYMVIVNRNLSGDKNIIFKIKGGAGLQLVQKDGTTVPASSVNSSQTVTPGDVLIYGWDI
jgi:hypothetical protein